MSLRSKCRNTIGSDNDVFVGLKFINGDISITFPLGYSIPNDEFELKKSILSLLKTISLTKSIDRSKELLNDNFKEKYNLPIFAYFSLIIDYIRNGLYHTKEKVYKVGMGSRINWKRTIQRSSSLISNDNLIYTNPIFERTKNIDTIITEIEKYCLNISLDYFSWYFGNIRVPKSSFSNNDIKYMLKILNKELSISFMDHKKKLINNMIAVLTGLDEKRFNNKAFTFGTNKYHVVWETMINDLYGSENLEEYYPSAMWHFADGTSGKASNLRPDSIYYDKMNAKFYVLDAKYYHYCVEHKVSKLPGSDSIQKQITYASYIHSNKLINNKTIDGNNIFNAFILPFDSNDGNITNNKDNKIVYFGYADCNWIIGNGDNSKYPYHKVALIFIDTKYIIDKWFMQNSDDLKELLVNIEKVLKP